MATNDDEQQDSKPQRSTRQMVYGAIKELRACNRQASRQAIAAVTGFKMSMVDDHVKNLRDDDLIRQVIPGIFEIVNQQPDRPVSGSIVEHNHFKLEVGDQVLDLTLTEARRVGLITGGLMAIGK